MIYTEENTAAIGKLVRVFVDDIEIPYAIMADDEAGRVDSLKIDEDGSFVVMGDSVVIQKHKGVVRVEPIE